MAGTGYPGSRTNLQPEILEVTHHYGGFVGCAYALTWNGQMYKDYSQAYQDIMSNNPNNKSYEDFLPPGTNVNDRLEYWQELFRSRKDLYRRQRDLSIFAFIGVYYYR